MASSRKLPGQSNPSIIGQNIDFPDGTLALTEMGARKRASLHLVGSGFGQAAFEQEHFNQDRN